MVAGRLRWLVAGGLAISAIACVYDPVYQGTRCDEGGACPGGYVCVGAGDQAVCVPETMVDGGDAKDADADAFGDPGDQPEPDAGDGDMQDAGTDAGDSGGDCLDPDMDGDGYDAEECGGEDCDDGREDVHPAAPELCDGRDNDCDGLVDADDDALIMPTCAVQSGVCQGARKTAELCFEGAWGDCTFQHYADHSAGYQEIESACDGLDNDCDGLVDNIAVAPACGLTEGVCQGAVQRCMGPAGWRDPCDPQDYGPDYEDFETRCDGLDNDCNGQIDGMARSCALSYMGRCGEGMETCNQGVWEGCPRPGEELCEPPGIDEDCDGSVDEGCACSEGAVRDCILQEGVCGGAQEVCTGGQWSGCDYASHSSEYEPPPEQSCDGLDNDCDGQNDGQRRSCADEHQGWCATGTETCLDTVWSGCPAPEQEVCDGIDNDCDGELDAEDAELVLDACELTAGVCQGAMHTAADCVDGQWQGCDPAGYGPDFQEIETACEDGLDNDCDGATDCPDTSCDGYVGGCMNECLPGHRVCQDGAWSACDAPEVSEESERRDNCGDGLDNDCDGKTDGDDDYCCGSVGVSGGLLWMFLLPVAARRRRRDPQPGAGRGAGR